MERRSSVERGKRFHKEKEREIKDWKTTKEIKDRKTTKEIKVIIKGGVWRATLDAVIYGGFFGLIGPPTKCLGGPIFEGRNEILLLGKALKFGVIFQIYALKLIKIWKIIEKIREKYYFRKIF